MKNILITEDEPMILELLEELFIYSNKFSKVFKASNGREALDILRNEDIHVLLTDINMPIINGIELIHIVEKEKLINNIFAMSGNLENKKKLLLNKDIRGFFSKPIVDMEELINKILNNLI